MSDLFVGEILVVILLLPVLLRPFFRRLQRIDGIPVLATISFVIALSLIPACGFLLSFFPVFVFSLLVFVVNFPRFLRLCRGLPTDLYGAVSFVVSIFLLLFLFPVGYVTFKTAPVPEIQPVLAIEYTHTVERVSPGTWMFLSEWTPDSSFFPVSRGLVLIQGDPISEGSRKTAAATLAGMGFRVVEPRYAGTSDYLLPILNVPGVRKAVFLLSRIVGYEIVTENGLSAVQDKNLTRSISFCSSTIGETEPFFIIAEGSGIIALSKAYIEDPGMASGLVCLSSLHGIANGFPEGAVVKFNSSGGSMPTALASFPVLILESGENDVLGEVAADDPLAAFLLGVPFDLGRHSATLVGRRAGSWFEMRRSYVIN